MSDNMSLFADSFMSRDFNRKSIGNLLSDVIDKIDISSHPLGFYRGRLGESHGALFYLHIWTPTYYKIVQSPELLIHSHSVDIRSVVLVGSLTDVRYTWQRDEKGRSRLFGQNRSGSGPRLLPTGDFGNAQRAGVLNVSEGQYYDVPWHDFHETACDSDNFVVTIAAFVGESTRSPMIIGPRHMNVASDYKAISLDAASRIAIISRIADHYDL